jgi:hypothetical protein
VITSLSKSWSIGATYLDCATSFQAVPCRERAHRRGRISAHWGSLEQRCGEALDIHCRGRGCCGSGGRVRRGRSGGRPGARRTTHVRCIRRSCGS